MTWIIPQDAESDKKREDLWQNFFSNPGPDIHVKGNLLFQFAMASLTFVLLAGFFLWWAMDSWAEKDAVQHVADLTAATYGDSISDLVTPTDFEGPMEGERLQEFDTQIKEDILSEENAAIKIWNKDGMIVYSSDSTQIGQQTPIRAWLQRALQGQVTARTLSEVDFENENLKKTPRKAQAEIFVPILSEGQIVGAYGMHQVSGTLYQKLRSLQLFIAYTLAGTLSLFYFAFLALMVRSSVRISTQNEELKEFSEELKTSCEELKQGFADTLEALIVTLDQKDPYSAGHSLRVAAYSAAIGQELNLPEEKLDRLNRAALFHDIGKVCIPESILQKPAKLTKKEQQVVRQHTVVGSKIINPLTHMKDIVPGVRHEHERFDGNGYPDGIRGKEIPFEARVIAVADSFDAMMSDRPYRRALTQKQAEEELSRNSGTQFDPELVEIFLKVIKRDGLPKDESLSEIGQQTIVQNRDRA